MHIQIWDKGSKYFMNKKGGVLLQYIVCRRKNKYKEIRKDLNVSHKYL